MRGKIYMWDMTGASYLSNRLLGPRTWGNLGHSIHRLQVSLVGCISAQTSAGDTAGWRAKLSMLKCLGRDGDSR